MTLSVSTYKRDPNTDEAIFDPYPNLGEDLAGPESWRRTVWSSATVRALGATFLPQLATHDVYIEFHELDLFLSEIEMLISHYEKSDENTDSILHRLNNFRKAAAFARSNQGGVHIG
ncbi:hypothetical protein [Hahella sp. NBU794]|uniref:hypothetical protein n=1 Tax=Hahella sp. NBU794 TaxID=3422590 RepID=UPI003D6EF626